MVTVDSLNEDYIQFQILSFVIYHSTLLEFFKGEQVLNGKNFRLYFVTMALYLYCTVFFKEQFSNWN